MVAAIASEPLLTLDYAEVVDAASLEPVSRLAGVVLVALAVHAGRARLLDNVTFTFSGSDVHGPDRPGSDLPSGDQVTVDLGRQAPCDAP